MFLLDLLFAVVFALLIASLLIGPIGWRHPRHPGAAPAALFLFLLLLAAIWALGAWMPPYGPALWGGYWFPYLIVGLVVALIVLAIGNAERPERPRPHRERPDHDAIDEDLVATGVAAVFGIFFWLLVVAALGALALRYA